MKVTFNHVTANLCECWVLASNLRHSADSPGAWVDEKTIHAIVVETIDVERAFRRQGECRAFLNQLCADDGFDMVIVEGVQNPILAEALIRWGWECDPGVMDFYHRRAKDAK
jgi:hypothetical protein